MIWASPWDYGTCCLGNQQRLRRARASTQSCWSLHNHAVSLEPSLFAHMKYGSRQRVWPKYRTSSPLDGCSCAFEELSLLSTKSTIISWHCSFDPGSTRMIIVMWRKKMAWKINSAVLTTGTIKQGSRYRSPLSPNAKKKYFWHKKNIIWRKQVAKKNRHLRMPLNRQLTSWITYLKSVADQ